MAQFAQGDKPAFPKCLLPFFNRFSLFDRRLVLRQVRYPMPQASQFNPSRHVLAQSFSNELRACPVLVFSRPLQLLGHFRWQRD
jgi:hypothetical protein